ncbi:hypothetical protein U9M48_039460, partial [Paspalum notatum var. saurae]
MALFRKFFYRKPPDGLLEITERVYVFDSCFTTDLFDDDKYRDYIGDIIAHLRSHFADASFMVFNFRDGEKQSLLANILSSYDMVVMDYPRQYEGCPLLTIEMIHHYLRSGESWLSLGQQNVLIMHCEHGGWAVLAFMLAGLLLYRKQFIGEQRTLEMIYRQAPRELVQLLSPLNPMPSQIRYLHYISRRNVSSEWPPQDRALTLDCVILRNIPGFNKEGGCRPIFRIYGQDPLLATSNTPKVLFATPKRSKYVRLYKKADCELIKIDIHCHIQGDVVLECISLDVDQEREEMMFRVMFNTAFIRSNILMLNRDEIDILWDAKDRFPKEFRAELDPMEVAGIGEKEGLPVEAFAKVQEMFSNVDWLDPTGDAAVQLFQRLTSSENMQLRQGFLSPSKKEAESLVLGTISPTNKHSGNARQEASNFEHFRVYENKQERVGGQKLTPLEPATNSEVNTGTSVVHEKLGSLVHKVDSNTEQSTSLEQPTNILKNIEPVLKDQNAKIAEQHDSGQHTSPTTIMSHRFPISSSCSALSGNSSPRSLSACPRFHSAPSALGIMALLEDHAGSGSSEKCGSTITSSTVSNHSTGMVKMTLKLPSRQHPSTGLTSAILLYSIISHDTTILSLMLGPCNVTGTPVVTKCMPPPPSPPALLVSDATTMSESRDSAQPVLKHSDLRALPERQYTFQSLGTSVLPTDRKKSSSVVIESLTAYPAPPPPPFPMLSTSSSSTYHLPPHSVPDTPSFSFPSASAAPQPPPPPPLLPSRPPASSSSLKLSGPPPSPPPPPARCSPSRSELPPPTLLASTSSTVRPVASLPLLSSNSSLVRPAAPPPPPAPISSLIRSSAPPPPPPPVTTSGPPPPPPPPGTTPSSPPPPMGKLMTSPPVPPPPNAPSISSKGASGNIVPPPAPPGGNAKLFGSQGRGPAPPSGPISKSFQSGQAVSRRSNLKPLHWVKVTRAMHGSLWAESQKPDETLKAPVFDMSELENLFSAVLPSSDSRRSDKSGSRASGPKSEKIHLIDLRRANNCGIMLTKVKMPLPDLMNAILALDDTVLDADQVDNLIKFTPTKDEVELLKGYKGDKQVLGECEQFFMELMKVPRVESKLRVFSFKIQFRSQVSDLKRNLNIVNSSAEEIRGSVKLKRIMQTILSLGNALNQGTARGSAVGFRLDSLLKLSDTRARNNKMTLMHYLSK